MLKQNGSSRAAAPGELLVSPASHLVQRQIFRFTHCRQYKTGKERVWRSGSVCQWWLNCCLSRWWRPAIRFWQTLEFAKLLAGQVRRPASTRHLGAHYTFAARTSDFQRVTLQPNDGVGLRKYLGRAKPHRHGWRDCCGLYRFRMVPGI